MTQCQCIDQWWIPEGGPLQFLQSAQLAVRQEKGVALAYTLSLHSCNSVAYKSPYHCIPRLLTSPETSEKEKEQRENNVAILLEVIC